MELSTGDGGTIGSSSSSSPRVGKPKGKVYHEGQPCPHCGRLLEGDNLYTKDRRVRCRHCKNLSRNASYRKQQKGRGQMVVANRFTRSEEPLINWVVNHGGVGRLQYNQ